MIFSRKKPDLPSRPAMPKMSLVQRQYDEEDDEPEKRPLQWHLVSRIVRYTDPFARKRNVLFVLTAIRSLQLPALAWVVGHIISGPITRGDYRTTVQWVVGYGVSALVIDFIFHFRQRFALELGEQVVNSLRRDIFYHVQRMPMSFFHKMRVGRIISRVTSDVEAVRIGIQDVVFASMVQFGGMAFAAVFMAFTDWVLFLVVLGMAPILWMLNYHFREKLSQQTRAMQESFSRVTATLAESVNGIRVTQGFVRQQTNAGLFRSLIADHSRYSVEYARTSAFLVPLIELNSQFFIATLLLLGGWQVFHGHMPAGDLIKFFFLINFFFAPIQALGQQYNQGLVAMASAERIFRLIDMKPDWKDDADANPLADPRVASHPAVPDSKFQIQGNSGSEIWKPSTSRGTGARVEFKNLSFGYDRARLVLHDISFVAEPGKTVALVGHTGSGKSSIINLVAKFYLPTDGELLLDGHEIRKITSISLHRQMGMVQQQNFLFSGTVLDNLRLGKPEATEADVVEAARQLDCLDMLEALPHGLATEVGEKGGALSVGQRQLICFTRAFLADPRILILDEATSAIDAITESRLQKALQRLLQGRTSFVVAHRLSTIRTADLVLVLDQGRIIERGTHAELFAQGGAYAALYRQFLQVDDRSVN